MAIWTHVPNFPVLFSVSPTRLCITLNIRQVHVAQMLWKWLWGNACVSESCVTDIICARDCLEHQAEVGKEPWSSVIPATPTCSVLIRDHLWLSSSWSTQLCLSPHSGCTWQEVQSEEKNQTTGSFFALPVQVLLFFNIYLYTNIPAWP